jgi:hypothetical protein
MLDLLFYVVELFFCALVSTVQRFPGSITIKYFLLSLCLSCTAYFHRWCLFNVIFHQYWFCGCTTTLINLHLNPETCYGQWQPRRPIITNTPPAPPIPNLAPGPNSYRRIELAFFRKFHQFSHSLTTKIGSQFVSLNGTFRQWHRHFKPVTVLPLL